MPASFRSPPAAPRCARHLAAALAAGACAPVHAAVLEGSPSPATWGVLAALGLVAVAVGAATVRRRDTRRGAANDEACEAAPLVHGEDPAAAQPPAPTGAAQPPDEMPAPEARRARRAAPAVVPAPAEATPAAPHAAAPGDGAHAYASQLFLALQHVDLSIDVLRRHLAGETRPMPAVWVMLLDLCRTHGRTLAFREIAAEFHARFNVCTPAWDSYPPDRSEPGLEAYPRIVQELTQSWGTHECRRLLDRLLYDNRQGGRRGFTMNAYNDLIALRRAADAVLETIEQDYAEESKVRGAYAAAEAPQDDDPAQEALAAQRSPLVRDLEHQLDSDIAADGEARSALEREHPALADALAREWRNAALAGRLCEMLARGEGGAPKLSGDARDDVELLRGMARRLADAHKLGLATE